MAKHFEDTLLIETGSKTSTGDQNEEKEHKRRKNGIKDKQRDGLRSKDNTETELK